MFSGFGELTCKYQVADDEESFVFESEEAFQERVTYEYPGLLRAARAKLIPVLRCGLGKQCNRPS